MKQPIITASLLALGLGLASAPALASETAERFREQGKQLDLTGFLQADNDARSRSFLYGSPHEHDFTVKQAGEYLFESEVPGGESEDYRVAAALLDDQGRVIARGEALGQNGGLAMRQRLAPGDYVLRVEGRKFGTRSTTGNSFYITVAGLDENGRRLEEGVSDGQGLIFSGSAREGNRSVFVRGRDDDVATLAAPAPETSGGAATGEASASAAASAAPQAEAQAPSAEQAPAQASSGVETIVTDVKIRARGEVLTFDMAERGSVAITTSTYPTGYEDTYRLELEVLDADGRVVAEGAGEGFDGDVDMQTELSPGRYRIRVQGQKFGSAMSGVNNYELKVQKRDRP
ncbi:hypothetical protein [Halomonas saccharevitans]|uniref:Pre-peptidase C-terminal domain-containing protein n=1 Tax=Halomonas saccharevitans TaxID=416872 RepID=A0A1I6Y298_9GAMM|nr:hypothetical protein [Halomonas saccharevitans]SFT44507.1 hypothetical protein SAMN04487956_10411 [Halomonas saccharevitans]